jgi:hypothetical protein
MTFPAANNDLNILLPVFGTFAEKMNRFPGGYSHSKIFVKNQKYTHPTVYV